MSTTTKPFPVFGDEFVWGKVVKVLEIGLYTIILYYPYLKGREKGVAWATNRYHLYINGKDTSRTFQSLDQALVGAVAIQNDGINTRAHEYFYKMVGIDTEED